MIFILKLLIGVYHRNDFLCIYVEKEMMINIFKWLWKGIKRFSQMLIISTWYTWLAVFLGLLVEWIWGNSLGVLTFICFVGIVIAYIFLRQFYWWLRGMVDYEGRGLPKLWLRMFGK